uniref:LeucinetRNA ligaseic/mitochondrial n=1 Tax=Rhizophora mucronata TaxID=61149 RepID=A0A2P2MC47_RHIMU
MSLSFPSLSRAQNSISAPSDLPIQFLCISLTLSGQSRSSKSSRRRSAYAVILSIHCLIGCLVINNDTSL